MTHEPNTLFRDRREAGKELAQRLQHYAGRSDTIVLGLPRGGVPVAFEVASALAAPLDIMLVRKLGLPGFEELAMGAIASGGIRTLNGQVIQGWNVTPRTLETVTAAEQRELDRRAVSYRGDLPEPVLDGLVVILVDDGLATGATMRAAIEAVRTSEPQRIVVAIPVGAGEICRELEREADEVVCLRMPRPFEAVAHWYRDFCPTSDDEVRTLLRAAREATQPSPVLSDPAARAVAQVARTGADVHDEILRRVGDAQYVLIGEASHGTEEFYRERAELTRRLILDKGFTGVAVEADWPDSYRVNRFVRGQGADTDANQALGDFKRFPHWMWRNTVVEEFVGWLRDHNETIGDKEAIGFYGLDLYSLGASIDAVISYLETVDPEAADRARHRYACFEDFQDDAQLYGYSTSMGETEPCEEGAVAQLLELQRRWSDESAHGDESPDDALFSAEQNARLARNAEAYYRSMFRGRASSWNLRDQHMAETLERLTEHLGRNGSRPRIVVWAHNSHLGDARATQMGASGEWNLGQLVRERVGNDAFLIGFSTYTGTVTAASDWGADAERKRVRPGLPRSWEKFFHELVPVLRAPRFLVPLGDPGLVNALRESRLERAIGVIYHPETERYSHYFSARLADQFDAVIHIDETQALTPLERTPLWEAGEPAETFPSGL